MVQKRGSILPLLFLSATTILWGDTVIKMSIGGDDIALPRKVSGRGSCEPCLDPPRPGDLITIYAGDSGIRRDRGVMSIILRKDAKKIYFVCHASKQYAQLSYPVSYGKLSRKGLGSMPDDLLHFGLTAPSATGRTQVKQWTVATFDATVVNGLRNQFRVHLAVADALGGDDSSILGFRKALHELEHSGHGWSELLPFGRGVPVVWEEAERQPQTEFVYREEVTDIQDRQVPPGTYEVPAGYREVKFDLGCVQFR